MSVRLGYACISIAKRQQGVYTGRTLTLKSMEEKGIKYVKDLALKNIADMREIIMYNEQRGIRFWRITSDLFPHMENPRAKKYSIDFAAKALADAGKLARELGHRITMHPGQFAQLGSPRAEVVEQTSRDLNLHAKILTMMGLKPELGSVMIIHGGGTFGNKEATIKRWEENFRNLPHGTQKFIALENDEWQYSVLDLLPICEKLHIPLCIDFFHHQVMNPGFNIFDPILIQRVMNTWKLRGIKPKCHWSNQKENARLGTHGDCVDDIPDKIFEICKKYDCDIMIEAKQKDDCTLKMYEKYFEKRIYDNRITWELR